MADSTDSSSRMLRTVVLLENPPRGVAQVLEMLMPSLLCVLTCRRRSRGTVRI